MTISEMILPEFDAEMKSTRKMLEALPDEDFGWKPHEKSMTLGRLASHVAEMPEWAVHTIDRDRLVLGPHMKSLNAGSKVEILAHFESMAEEARMLISSATDEHFMKIWEMESGGKVFISMPRAAVLRSVVMNHMIHHRAQLGVYLRLKDVAVPGMYGPSADEMRSF